jgi:hypothetical protein
MPVIHTLILTNYYGHFPNIDPNILQKCKFLTLVSIKFHNFGSRLSKQNWGIFMKTREKLH